MIDKSHKLGCYLGPGAGGGGGGGRGTPGPPGANAIGIPPNGPPPAATNPGPKGVGGANAAIGGGMYWRRLPDKLVLGDALPCDDPLISPFTSDNDNGMASLAINEGSGSLFCC